MESAITPPFKEEKIDTPVHLEHKPHSLDIHAGEGLRSKFEELSMLETIKTFKKAIAICFLAAFSASCDGYQIGINGNIIANDGFIEAMGNTIDPKTGDKILSASTLSAFSSMISVGQVIGMVTLPFISDRWGRKVAMYTLWSILMLSVLFESVANDWRLWLVGKLFAGIGVGCLQLTLPTYITELAPYKIRGGMIAFYNIWWSVGGIFPPVVLHSMAKSDASNWKTPVYTQWAMLGLMIIIYIVLIPESPWWAASKGKDDLGKKLLQQINGAVPEYDVEEEWAIIQRTVQLEREMALERKNESFTAIFKGINGLRTLAGMWSLVTSQFLGLALIGTYTTYFFELAGQDDPFQTTIITSCVGLLAVIFALLLSDKVGRYWLLNGAITVGWLSLLFIGVVDHVPKTGATGNSLVFLACLWTFCNNLNYTVSWGMMAEVPAARLRTKSAGFSAACSAVAGIIFVVITPYMINVNNANWGLRTCFFFFGIGAPFAIGAWFIIPETANRSPAELDELYESKVKPWRFAKTVTQVQVKRAAGEVVDEGYTGRLVYAH